MHTKIKSALLSVFYKDGIEQIAQQLILNGVTIYSTGGTLHYLESCNIPCVPVESITQFPPILGGRVKTLHPLIFGGILSVRDNETHSSEMLSHHIPYIDLVIVDLYPFEETVQQTDDEALIIEKIDIGGPSMIRAAAKNFKDVTVVASKNEYSFIIDILRAQNGITTLEQRKMLAIRAFEVCSKYDHAISNYFSGKHFSTIYDMPVIPLRYGENPHQSAEFYGSTANYFRQLQGKEISYNNLVDIDAALQLLADCSLYEKQAVFAIIKHTNVCGMAVRESVEEAWKAALEGDPESAFGGVLICNNSINASTAHLINDLFFEVLIAPGFDRAAIELLQTKKNRILLHLLHLPHYNHQQRSVLGGVLLQEYDKNSAEVWSEKGGRVTTAAEKADLSFANVICKHLKSNAIAIVKNMQLIGKGCGETSRIDALRHALEKATRFAFDLKGAVIASDAFFPFDDCVQLAAEKGITAFIQPGGSLRDKDSIAFCEQHRLAMVITGVRHFKH